MTKLDLIGEALPVYEPNRGALERDYKREILRKYGSFGGDMQWGAIADIISCDIFTYDHAAQGDVIGAWYAHGLTHQGQRGRWTESSGVSAVTLSAAIAHCNHARTSLVIFPRLTRHWHVLLPHASDGEV